MVPILIVVLRKTIAIVLRAQFGTLFVDFNNTYSIRVTIGTMHVSIR